MPRNIPLSNGKLLVCFDDQYRMRDLYFPHVGQENHLGDNHGRLGVGIGNLFSWVGSQWEIDLRYETDTLVAKAQLSHKKMEEWKWAPLISVMTKTALSVGKPK